MNKEEIKKTLEMLIKNANSPCYGNELEYLSGLRSNLFGCYLFNFITREEYDELVKLINDAIAC